MGYVCCLFSYSSKLVEFCAKMSKKNSDFFNKKSIKIETSEEDVSRNIDDKMSVKSEFGEKLTNSNKTSAENPQNLPSINNSGQRN